MGWMLNVGDDDGHFMNDDKSKNHLKGKRKRTRVKGSYMQVVSPTQRGEGLWETLIRAVQIISLLLLIFCYWDLFTHI